MFKLLSGILLATTLSAQTPTLLSGQPQSVPAGPNAQAKFRELVSAARDPIWIGYSVPAVEGMGSNCCYSSSDWMMGCTIEPGDRSVTRTSAGAGTAKLEAFRYVLILFRAQSGVVERISTFSGDCPIDAGSRAVYWLDGVTPADSLTILRSLIPNNVSEKDKIARSAFRAISLHDEPSVFAMLESTARSSADPNQRAATAALAHYYGSRGLASLRRMLNDQSASNDPRNREHLVSMIYQSRDPQAISALIEIARSDRDRQVRKRAVFWLSRSRTPEAQRFIDAILK